MKSLCLAIVALCILASAALCLEIPPLESRVNDRAGILSPQTVERLERELAALEQRESTQIVLLTLPSLEGDSMESFGIRLAEAWKIGQKGRDNGAILIISRDDRKIRIEVGRGLEGLLTDLVSGQIIRNEIAPRFKAADYDGGVAAGIAAIAKAVSGEFKAEAPTSKARRHGPAPVTLILAVAVACIFAGSISRMLGVIVGAAAFPVASLFILPGLGVVVLVLLAIIGSVFGLLLPLLFGGGGMGGPFFFGGGGFGGFSGGSSSGGGFSDGGFSGGGGDFGGGGASGDW